IDSDGTTVLGGTTGATAATISIGAGSHPYATAPTLITSPLFYMIDNAPFGGVEIRGNNGNALAFSVHSGGNIFGTTLAEIQDQNTSDTGLTLLIQNKGSGDVLQLANNNLTWGLFKNDGRVAFG